LPQVVLGDFDSIDHQFIALFQERGQIIFIHAEDQAATDLEKGLRYVMQ